MRLDDGTTSSTRRDGPAKRWLVTGATGTVGPALVDEIARTGSAVRVLTRQLGAPPTGWPWSATVQVATGDMTDQASLITAMQQVDFVVHAAGIAHRRPNSAHEAREIIERNVDGSRLVAEVARACGVQRVVFISSAAVYGAGTHNFCDESTPMRPTSAYGRSKVEAEDAMAHVLGAALTVLRVCAVYSPRLRGQYGLLANAVRSPWPVPFVEGEGHCLITDRDLARVVRFVVSDPALAGSVLNVSDGHTYSVREIVKAISESCERPAWRTPVAPAWVGDTAVRLLLSLGGEEWTRRQHLSAQVRSLVHGPSLDSRALRRALPDLLYTSLSDGWAHVMVAHAKA
jgi:nucleoside-diphosphate-sugar epimerase